jgi:hypothetical protein
VSAPDVAPLRPATGAGRPVDVTTGLLLAAVVLAMYGGMALTIDYPRAAYGFKSDEATYYMMAHSLAEDGDLTYRREDLARVWREFPAGPTGVFLKRGREVRVGVNGTPPFVHLTYAPDPDVHRLFYGKSYMYPLIAAPFVWAVGTNGFLFLNALLLAALVLAGYLFVAARAPAASAALFGAGYFMATVTPGYVGWITPELFNLATVTLAYFCWLYKEVAPPALPRGFGWLRTGWSDVAAVVLLALASCSKPPNAALIGPIVLLACTRRRWRWGLALGTLFAVLVGAFFVVNLISTGDLNFQGGDRRTYYEKFPFMDPTLGFDAGMDRTTNQVLTDIVFDQQVFWPRLGWNIVYFFVGRHSGMLPYFFPGLFALALFLWPRTRRLSWQWLVFAAVAGESLLQLVWLPYTYYGGPGVLGSRYYMNVYGLQLFLLPALSSVTLGLVPWIVGCLFTAKITLNPFFYSFYPYEHAKAGPLRWLPVELTLVNDLPINTNVTRVRQLFGQAPRFQIYFLDDNAYPRDAESFWIRGRSRADMLFKTPEPASHVKLTVANGPRPTTVIVTVDGARVTTAMGAGETAFIQLPIGAGFPYQGTRVWYVTIAADTGHIPLFDVGGEDVRYLGVKVTPELLK